MKSFFLITLLAWTPLLHAGIFCQSDSGRTHVALYFDEGNDLAAYRMGIFRQHGVEGAFYISESLVPSLGEERQYLNFTTDHEVACGAAFYRFDANEETDTKDYADYFISFQVNHREGWGYAGLTYTVASFTTKRGSGRLSESGQIEFEASLNIRFDDQSPWGSNEQLQREAELMGLDRVVGRAWNGIKLNCVDNGVKGDLPGPPGPGEG